MKELLLRRKTRFFLYLLATFMFVIDHFAQMGLFSYILGAIEKGDITYYKNVIIVTVIFILYSPINFLISRMLRIRYMRDTILDVRRMAFDKIINLPFKKYSQKSKEIYLSNLINDVNTFENKFFHSFLNFLINIAMISISIIILLVLDIKLAISMIIFSLLLIGMAKLFEKKTTELEQKISTTNEEFTTEMSNTFQGIEILKLNHIEDKFLKKGLLSINRLEKRKYQANVFSELQRNIIQITGFITAVLVLIYLGYQIQDDMSLAVAGLLFQLCSSISRFLIDAFPMLNRIKASISIYDKIAKPEEGEGCNSSGALEFVFQDKIEVSNVNFSFDKKEVLKNASFTIEKGKKYLIKGVSGAGKSTLMNLLAMVYDNYEGKITVDQVDYKTVQEKSFHDKVAFIYQNVFLFEDTIKNNIALYREVSPEQMDATVKACGLEAIIEERKDGLEEKLTENGKNLSGGQRQRLSIARAIAKNAQILFVDEGTSSLNEEMGREIEKVFLSLEHTVIAISHRFYEGVTDQYDYVLELKNGAVNCFTAKEYFDEVITC
ncbi:MAG: ABC transporter ATP-binding protein [Mobilitalea sp.]